MGISESQLAFAATAPEDELPTIRALARGLARLPKAKSLAWRRESWDPEEVAQHPERFRGQLWRCYFRASRIRQIGVTDHTQADPSLADQSLVDPTPIWELTGTRWKGPDAADTKVRVLCAEIPSAFRVAWEAKGPLDGLDEPLATTAFFLEQESPSAPQCFVAHRIEWYPDQATSPLSPTSDWLSLAQQGVDIGRLADVRDRRPLEPQGRDVFYQLLIAAGDGGSRSAHPGAGPPIFSPIPRLPAGVATRSQERPAEPFASKSKT